MSPDMDANYPSALKVTCSISLNNNNELKMVFGAENVGDKTTIVNLCNHGYWNLAGHETGSILEQIVQINADKYTAVDDALIITGETPSVAGTPFDFREAKAISEHIA